jgi:hypothetical protein
MIALLSCPMTRTPTGGAFFPTRCTPEAKIFLSIRVIFWRLTKQKGRRNWSGVEVAGSIMHMEFGIWL